MLQLGLISLVLAQAPGTAPQTTVVVGQLRANEGGPRTQAADLLSSPFGIDFDAAGRMLIVELGGGRVFRRTPDGTVAQVGGDGTKGYEGDGGPLKASVFNGMHNVAMLPDGTAFIADSWNNCIRKVTPDGTITTLAGTGEAGFAGEGGSAKDAKFDFLMCVSLNPANDKLYIADLKNRRIRMLDLKTNVVTTIAGNGKTGVPANGARATESPLVDPRAVAVDKSNNVYILERKGHCLRVVTPDGRIRTVAGTGKAGADDGPALKASMKSPKHIAIDDDQSVLIADEANKLIRRYDPTTETVTTILGGGIGSPPIHLSKPHGVCVEQGKIYVVDTGHNRILRIENEVR